MTLQEELEFWRKNVVTLQEKTIELENDNDALKAKNWNLENKLNNITIERDRLSKEVENLKEEKKELNFQKVYNKSVLSEKIKALELENRDIKSKAIQLQKVYNEHLNKYYEQCKSEIAKARNNNMRQEALDCLNRNNGNKTKAAKELGISRQALYQRINKRMV